jgi:small subunit ribosomal protein S26e
VRRKLFHFFHLKSNFPHFRNIVDASALRDIRDASAYENYALPKLYIKQYYCIEAAVHQRIVRVRSAVDRRNRAPPVRGKPKKD